MDILRLSVPVKVKRDKPIMNFEFILSVNRKVAAHIENELLSIQVKYYFNVINCEIVK